MSGFTVTLQRYAGPLDLLLDLVRRGRYAIEDLPIATITAQYLEYLRQATEMDIELGSEFIHIASVLIQIKSRALLPRDPALAEADPRAELARQLLTHEEARRAAEMLAQRIAVEGASWSAVWEEEGGDAELAAPPAGDSLWDLLQRIRTLRHLDWSRSSPFVVGDEGLSQEELIERAKRELARDERLAFDQLAVRCGPPNDRAGLFLSVLELARRGVVGLEQTEAFVELMVCLRQ